MPVELSLELVAIFGSNFLDAERELFNDVINEVDGICLGMYFIDFESSDTGSTIDSSIL